MNQRRAKTAIIMRTKNRPLLLKRAIDSVLAQTHKEFLHLIFSCGGDNPHILMNSSLGDSNRPVSLGNPAGFTIHDLAERITNMTGSTSEIVYNTLLKQ